MAWDKCGRFVTEVRVPGNNHAPDGPPETWRSICELPRDHEGEHDWHVWFHVYE